MAIIIIGDNQPMINVLGIVALIAAIWVIYDVLTVHKKWSSERKAIWIIAALIFSIITAVVYYLVIKKKK